MMGMVFFDTILKRVGNVLKQFSQYSGLVSTIIDLDGNVLFESNITSICEDFHFGNSVMAMECKHSFRVLATVKKDEEYKLYECKNGLVAVSFPIVLNGKHIASITTGQVILNKLDVTYFEKQADLHHLDKKEYMEAIKNIRILSIGEIERLVKYLKSITTMIVEEINTELLMERNQTLFKASLESTKKTIIAAVDRDYNYIYMNSAHKNAMKEIYGTEVGLGDNLLEAITVPEMMVRSKANHDLALSGHAHSAIHSYGNGKHYEITFSPIYDEQDEIIGASVFSVDISDIKRVNKELMNSESRYKKLIESLDSGVMTQSLEHIVLSINQRACDMFGLTPDVVGKEVSLTLLDFVDSNGKTLPCNLNPFQIIIDSGEMLKDYVVGLRTKESVKWIKCNGTIHYNDDNEVEEVVASFVDITKEKQRVDEIMYINDHDFLTNVYNRRYYEESLNTYDSEEYFPISIVLADINGLKLINDAFGHEKGDEYIKITSKLICDNIASNHIPSRVGGDEFSIVMPNTSFEEAVNIVEMINQDLSKIDFDSIRLSISFGVSTKTDGETDIHKVCMKAEELMYREKLNANPSTRSNAINAILSTLHEKDPRSELHSRRVAAISEMIATEYGCKTHEISEIRTAALLHDIGKIMTPIEILNKEGKLIELERREINKHPEIGFRILSTTQDMRNIANIIFAHHENWDGSGYPRGLEGKEIPLSSRIIAVADAYEAMTGDRLYRDPYSSQRAFEELIHYAGIQFDPEIVKLVVDNELDFTNL